MKKSKRLLAGLMALAMVIPMAACGKDAEDESQVDVVTVPSSDNLAPLPDDATKTLKWLSYYDINPAIGGERSTALSLFEDSCGGKIQWVQTAWDTQFDDLAAQVMSNNAPDLFPYTALSFPYHVTRGFYQPVDDIVDFTNPLWSDVAEAAEQYTLNGQHYVAPLSFSSTILMAYNKEAIEANGFDDPYELYQAGDWNWNSFKGVMSDWMSTANEEEIRYGINGWFIPFIVQQTGKTMVVKEDGAFRSNIYDPDIERAEAFCYDLVKDGYVENYWYGNARNCFKTGTTLFYAMGSWGMTGTANGPQEGDNWGIVPVPSDPNNTGDPIVSTDTFAYMWIKGSTSNEAMKAWLECNRIAETEEQYKTVNREKFFAENKYWTDEMYEAKNAADNPEAIKIFDYIYGVSQLISDETTAEGSLSIAKHLYEDVVNNDENGVQNTWAQLRETYGTVLDAEIDTLNAEVAKMQ